MRIKTRIGSRTRKKASLFPARKRFCQFCRDKSRVIDYKDVKRLEFFIKDRAKIISRHASGNCAKHQRMLAEAIKNARFLSLLPYTRM